MRITDKWIVGDVLKGIFSAREQLSSLQLQLATQKKIHKPSDDPRAMGVILRTQAELARVEQYEAAVGSGKSLLKLSAESLDRVAALLQDVKGLVAGVTTQTDHALLMRYADDIENYANLAMEIGNTKLDGKSIFGGTVTTELPFVKGGTSGEVLYRGNSSPLEYQVADGVSQPVSLTGAAAFMATGELSFDGALDRLAMVGSRTSTTTLVTDAVGVAHPVRITFEKAAANVWTVKASSLPGMTNGIVRGGSATIVFDPSTGQVADFVRGAPLTLTPTSGSGTSGSAPPMVIQLTPGNLTEQTGGWSPSTTYRSVSVFEKLLEISDTLRSGGAPTEDDVYMIGVMRDHVLQEGSRAGFLTQNLNAEADYLSGVKQHLLDVQGAEQEVDLVEVGVKLKQQETVLQAVLSSAAQILPRSLLDYLK